MRNYCITNTHEMVVRSCDTNAQLRIICDTHVQLTLMRN